MTRFKTSRWRSSFLVVVLIATLLTTLFSGLVTKAPSAYAASIGTCDFASKTTVNNCSFINYTFTGSGNDYSFTNNCNPRIGGQLLFDITVGRKIPTGGYNADIKTSGAVCPGVAQFNGTLTINDPNSFGPNNGNPGTGGTGPGAGGNANAPPTCESQGGDLAWILCGIFNEVGSITAWIITNIIQPFLVTAPVSTNPADPSYKIWSNFRIYGDVFLVFALLAIVFGQSIGGGLVDAYTAKKVLPRLLIAAILINLSVYIVAFLVDITNILGQGVGNLITEPLRSCAPQTAPGNNQCWNFALTQPQEAGVFGIGIIGMFVGGAGAAAGLLALGSLAGAGAAIGALFFVLLPMLIAMVLVFVTLIIRKGIILVLLLISPVAFALYCLPNTEKYFRKWWDALLETLMVYPIIMAVFAIAELLSVTVLTASKITPDNLNNGGNFLSNNASPILAVVIAFIAQFLPLFLIPFAFRIAGGMLGRIHEASTNAGNRFKQSGWYDRNRKDQTGKWKQHHTAGKQTFYNAASRTPIIGGAPILGRQFAKRRERYEQQTRLMASNDILRDPRFQGVKDYGDALKAVQYGSHGNAIAMLQEKDGLSLQQATAAVSAWEGTGLGWSKSTAAAALQAGMADGYTFTGHTQKVQDKAGNHIKLSGDQLRTAQAAGIADEDGYLLKTGPRQRQMATARDVASGRASQIGEMLKATDAEKAANLADSEGNLVARALPRVSALQEAVEMAARIGGNNASTRANLAGMANAVTKQAGRYDMAPGFGGDHGWRNLVDRVANGDSVTPDDYREAQVIAMRGTSNTTLAAQTKMPGIKEGSRAIAEQLAYYHQLASSPQVAEQEAMRQSTQRGVSVSTNDVLEHANKQLAELTAKYNNMRSQGAYGSEAVSAEVFNTIQGEPPHGAHQGPTPSAAAIQHTEQIIQPRTTTETVIINGQQVQRNVPVQDTQGQTRYTNQAAGEIFARDNLAGRPYDPRMPGSGGPLDPTAGPPEPPGPAPGE